MEIEKQIIIESKKEKIYMINISQKKIINIIKNNKKFLYLLLLILFITFIIFIIIFKHNIKQIYSIKNIKKDEYYKRNDIYKLNGIDRIINNKSGEKIIKRALKEQNDFCINKNKYYNDEFESQIKLTEINFGRKSYYMYIYKNNDIVSNYIYYNKHWEKSETYKILEALEYYSKIKNIKNSNIYILDIGCNVGWYTLILGKYGYNVISFEPSEINNYILKKNYCKNKELNIILIKQGLNDIDKKCDFYISNGNIGDGWVFCNGKRNIPNHLKKKGEVLLTKLNYFIPYLSNKNLALIKIDVEGSEEKVFEGGIELLSKYHVPFIFMEFSPDSLKNHGTEPKEFLKLFEKNGYKFNNFNFFDKNYISIEDIIQKTDVCMNLYIIYSKIFE